MKDKLPTTIPLPKRIELAENGKTKKLNSKIDVASALNVSTPTQSK